MLDIFKKTEAFLEGHFILSSGLHSEKYLQCAKVLQYPEHAQSLCSALAGRFRRLGIDTVVAPAIGGILVSYEVARALGLRSVFMERVDGSMRLRRGFTLDKGERVLVTEDVITTGLSTREILDVVRSSGASLAGVGCLIDRSEGEIDFGVRFESLLKIKAPLFKPEDCPLCKKQIPVSKPGSRKA